MTDPRTSSPFLSIIATARNDNHGGDLLRRMQLFIDGLLEQCDRFRLPAELVLVEWNPPPDRPRLAEALDWSRAGGCIDVRIIEVPPSLHARLKHADRLPLFQMIGKNVGIRRARGSFILATNIDILFSNELIAHIARQRLRQDRMYRLDRWDVQQDVPVEGSIDERLAWCRSHCIRLEGRDGTRDMRTGAFHRIYWEPTWRVRLLEALQEVRLVPVVTRKRLHLNACGDFTLMHRRIWERVRGYPEMQMYSMHLDSVLCTAAYFAGAREHVWRDPLSMFHIEHGTGSGFTPEGQAALDARLAAAGVPQLSHAEFHRWALEMRRTGRPMIFNEETWGLREEALTEMRVGGKGSVRSSEDSQSLIADAPHDSQSLIVGVESRSEAA